MNKTEIQDTKNCWSKVLNNKGLSYFAKTFYAHLFTQNPEVKKLFSHDFKQQQFKLVETLGDVINGIGLIDELEPALLALGKKHQEYGVEIAHYDIFIDVILQTFQQASNNSLSEAERHALKKSFTAICQLMVKAYTN